jgi:hypothetical protein
MSMLASRLDRASVVSRTNLRLLEELDEQLAQSRAGGDECYVPAAGARHRSKVSCLIADDVRPLSCDQKRIDPGAQEIWKAVENYCNSIVPYFSHGRRLSNPSWCRMMVVRLAEYAGHSLLGSLSSGVWENPAYDAQRTCCDN